MANLIVAVYRRALDTGWPWDLGDDPSFESSIEVSSVYGKDMGRITWGVCRPQVRNALKADDLVVFVATGRQIPCSYQLTAFATVERKVARDQVWHEPELSTYIQYRNLLVKRESNGFRHVESTHFGQKVWHRDWLCRIFDGGLRHHPDFVSIQRSNYLRDEATVGSVPVRFAANYVLFRAEGHGTFVAFEPPVIATASRNGEHETWEDSPFAHELREVVFGDGPREWLRSRHRQISHPHFRRQSVDTDSLFRQLLDLCQRFGVKSRVEQTPDVPGAANDVAKRHVRC